jgi:hypothetical protein
VVVSNFGSLPILDVELTDATWSEHPGARWVTTASLLGSRPVGQVNLHRAILQPVGDIPEESRTSPYVSYDICFLDATEDRPLRAEENDTWKKIHLTNVVAKIRFTTANGVRWEMASKGTGGGEPVRL